MNSVLENYETEAAVALSGEKRFAAHAEGGGNVFFDWDGWNGEVVSVARVY